MTALLKASEQLEQYLQKAITELRGEPMADTGAKEHVQSLSEIMAEVKSMIGNSMTGVKAAMLEQGKKMAEEYSANGSLVVKKMQDQHEDAMTQFNDLLGNERAGDK